MPREGPREVEELPAKRRVRLNDEFLQHRFLTVIMATTTHEARLGLALADLAKQDKPNFMGTARKHGVNDTTLRRRFRGNQLSHHAAASEYRQCLTHAQEEALIGAINSLTDRGIPPTSRMVRNLAEEMIQKPIGKNWTRQFVKRHENRLISLYLRNLNSQRVKAEYAPMFKQFYDLVTYIWIIID